MMRWWREFMAFHRALKRAEEAVRGEMKPDLECRLNNIETRLSQLECPHDGEMKFESGLFVWAWWQRKCAKCGKVLERYGNPEDAAAARIAYEQARLDEDKKRLKERQKKAK